jgi:hypothetical protein
MNENNLIFLGLKDSYVVEWEADNIKGRREKRVVAESEDEAREAIIDHFPTEVRVTSVRRVDPVISYEKVKSDLENQDE